MIDYVNEYQVEINIESTHFTLVRARTSSSARPRATTPRPSATNNNNIRPTTNTQNNNSVTPSLPSPNNNSSNNVASPSPNNNSSNNVATPSPANNSSSNTTSSPIPPPARSTYSINNASRPIPPPNRNNGMAGVMTAGIVSGVVAGTTMHMLNNNNQSATYYPQEQQIATSSVDISSWYPDDSRWLNAWVMGTDDFHELWLENYAQFSDYTRNYYMYLDEEWAKLYTEYTYPELSYFGSMQIIQDVVLQRIAYHKQEQPEIERLEAAQELQAEPTITQREIEQLMVGQSTTSRTNLFMLGASLLVLISTIYFVIYVNKRKL